MWATAIPGLPYGPTTTSLELRTGSVSSRVADVTREQQADLVVLSWSQDISRGHAAVIHDVLSQSNVPVLLLPTMAQEPDRPSA